MSGSYLSLIVVINWTLTSNTKCSIGSSKGLTFLAVFVIVQKSAGSPYVNIWVTLGNFSRVKAGSKMHAFLSIGSW